MEVDLLALHQQPHHLHEVEGIAARQLLQQLDIFAADLDEMEDRLEQLVDEVRVKRRKIDALVVEIARLRDQPFTKQIAFSIGLLGTCRADKEELMMFAVAQQIANKIEA